MRNLASPVRRTRGIPSAAPSSPRARTRTARGRDQERRERVLVRRRYVLLLVAIAAVLGSRAVEPLVQYVAATDRVADLQAERDVLAVAVDDLEAQRDALDDPEQVELLAREELGLVRPGELPFVVVAPPADAATEEPGAPPELTPTHGSEDDPWWVDLARALERWRAGPA